MANRLQETKKRNSKLILFQTNSVSPLLNVNIVVQTRFAHFMIEFLLERKEFLLARPIKKEYKCETNTME